MRLIAAASLSFLSLISFGQVAKVDPPADSLEAKLYEAVIYGQADKVEELLAKGAKATLATAQVPNPMFKLSGNKETLARMGKALMAAGADIHAYDAEGNGLLSCWLIKGNDNNTVLEYFLGLGLDPNEMNKSGSTPLFEAAASGRYTHFAPLVKAGAHPKLKTKWGETAEQYFRKHTESMIDDLAGFPDSTRRDDMVKHYISEMTPYLLALNPKAEPFQARGPKLEATGYRFERIYLLGSASRNVAYRDGKAFVTLTFEPSETNHTATITDADMRGLPCETKLPITLKLEAKKKQTLTLQFPAPNALDAVMNIFFTDSRYPEVGLRVASDDNFQIPFAQLRNSGNGESSTITIYSWSRKLSVRVLKVLVNGKAKEAFDGAELAFDRGKSEQEIPGLTIEKGDKAEVTFEFRYEGDKVWRQTTVSFKGV